MSVLVAVGLISSGCGRSPHTHKQKVLRLNMQLKPFSLDPRKIGDTSSSTLQFMLGEGLTRKDEHSTTSPALAERIEVSDDGMVYTFYLREAYWSDGTPITSDDFFRSWRDQVNPDFPSLNSKLLYPIKNAEASVRREVSLDEVGIRTLGPRCIEVTLERPTPYFLELTSFYSWFPVPEALGDHFDDTSINNPESFLSCGPFRLGAKSPRSGNCFGEESSLLEE